MAVSFFMSANGAGREVYTERNGVEASPRGGAYEKRLSEMAVSFFMGANGAGREVYTERNGVEASPSDVPSEVEVRRSI